MIRMVRLVLVLAAVALGLTPATAGTHAWSRMVDCAQTAAMVSAHAAHGVHAGQDMLEDHGAARSAKSVLSHDCCLTAVQAILAATAALGRPVLSPAAEPLVPTALDGLVITPTPPPPKIRV